MMAALRERFDAAFKRGDWREMYQLMEEAQHGKD